MRVTDEMVEAAWAGLDNAQRDHWTLRVGRDEMRAALEAALAAAPQAEPAMFDAQFDAHCHVQGASNRQPAPDDKLREAARMVLTALDAADDESVTRREFEARALAARDELSNALGEQK